MLLELAQIVLLSQSGIGIGCRDASSYSLHLSEDKQTLSVEFNDATAQIGPGMSLIESRKNCSLTVQLETPGYQYRVKGLRHRSEMRLDAFVKAEYVSNFFFRGSKETGVVKASEIGPRDDTYEYYMSDKLGAAEVRLPDSWSSCSETSTLLLNTQVRMSKTKEASPHAYGYANSTGCFDGAHYDYELEWRKCPE